MDFSNKKFSPELFNKSIFYLDSCCSTLLSVPYLHDNIMKVIKIWNTVHGTLKLLHFYKFSVSYFLKFFLLFLPLDPDPRTQLNPDPTRIRICNIAGFSLWNSALFGLFSLAKLIYIYRWQNLVTRAEERHKLVTASLNFYKTAEQVTLQPNSWKLTKN